jgi:bifunctional DNA-binding transcriptional regulator/antitoxin component of YhaV-PrlF toxin-antitoxin module
VTLSESRVSKGYLTVVPRGVRRAAEITAGDVLEWEVEGDQVKVRKRTRRTIKDVSGMISHGGDAVRSKREVQGLTDRVH